MKTRSPITGFAVLLAACCCFQSSPLFLQAGPVEPPTIRSVQLDGSEVVVTVVVPDGVRRVTLESRARLGSGAWIPRAVARSDGNATELVFRLTRSSNLEILRVRADATEPLPLGFYLGTTNFTGQPNNTGSPVFAGPGTNTDDLRGGESSETREVAESDIWKIRGDTLYYFNSYRGLQVIDVSVPDQPRLKGTLALPAVGEQMYSLGDGYVVLLARRNCNWGPTGPESQILIVRDTSGSPSVVAEIPLEGAIRDSRLVGSALYLALETWRQVDGGSWSWGAVLTAVDLADPVKPVRRESLWYPGYPEAVTATDTFFFLSSPATNAPNRSLVRCIDITAPDGSLREHATVTAFGRVADKFKIHWADGLLKLVSESSGVSGGSTVWLTKLELFGLPDPRTVPPVAVTQLGSVELGHGERLFATRFDGTRAYVVTFLRIDPLWIVDFADPMHPKVAGELQVPGWSTYIHPLGDRLISLGIDNTNGWRVAVSLFDVRDPAKPIQLSRVALGDGYSWSEATEDEKAFAVLPDAGLLLVPWTGMQQNEYGSQVQLVDFDLTKGSLTLRGVIEHRFQPRRSTLHRERILSVSGVELLTVDATDRDHPAIRATLPLAWEADQVLLVGDSILEVARGNTWGGVPSLRVVPAADPSAAGQSVSLPETWPVVAVSLQSSRLYLAQAAPETWPPPTDPNPNPPPPNLSLAVYDLTRLPELTLVSQALAIVPSLGWSPQFEFVWPHPDLAVLAGGEWWYWRWLDWGLGPADGIRGGPIYGSTGDGVPASRFLAWDVAQPAIPKLVSDFSLKTDTRWDFSPAFTAQGCLYVSCGEQAKPDPIVTFDESTGQWHTNTPPEWLTILRHQLWVIDYADPLEPTPRKPVVLPGRLAGLDRQGALLLTTGTHWKPDPKWTFDYTQWLDASAYDGVSAHLVDSLAFPELWPQPLLIRGGMVYLGRTLDSAGEKQALETWALADTGRFSQLGRLMFGPPAWEFHAFNHLLVARGNTGLRFVDTTAPAAPVDLGVHTLNECLWYDLGGADGSLERGLWMPLGIYGVVHVAP